MGSTCHTMSKRKRGGKKSEQASPSFEGWQTLSCDDAGLDADEMSELVSIEVLDGGDEPLLRKFEPEAARQKKGKKGAKAEAKAEAITEAEKEAKTAAQLDKEARGKDKLRRYKEKMKRKKEAKRQAAAAGTEQPEEAAAVPKAVAAAKGDKRERPMKKKKKKQAVRVVDEQPEDAEQVMDEWAADGEYRAWLPLGLDNKLLRGVEQLGFVTPTPIQAAAVPIAITTRKDVVGAAETGSGKTLAFGLPVLQRIMQHVEATGSDQLLGLIISPTRELAVQIKDHINAVAAFTGVEVAVIVGGLSQQKQERLLARKPGIVVGTPGRLHSLITDKDPHLSNLDHLLCLVLDEADRLVDQGHFVEITKLIEYISTRQQRADNKVQMLAAKNDTEAVAAPKVSKVQKFLFSATMTLEKRGKSFQAKKVSGVENETLAKLIQRLELRGDPAFVDYSGARSGLKSADKLQESAIQCPNEEKELYLYYFLHSFPGRTLVFVNAVSMVRRLAAILKNLNLPVFPLHADMQQRQRLKNMDRFAREKNIVLIASDVAARGIDVQNVDHVVHFHVPFTADTYIHRCGRTARAEASGTSVVLVSGQEQTAYMNICRVLKKGVGGLELMPIQQKRLPPLRTRLRLAKNLDKEEHSTSKKKADKTWMQRSAEALDIELDDDGDKSDDEFQAKQGRKQAQSIRNELDGLLMEEIPY